MEQKQLKPPVFKLTEELGEDKAQVLWNDGDGEFQLLKGSSDASLDVGSVDAEEVLIPSGGKIKINSVSLGDYSLFASALDTAKA